MLACVASALPQARGADISVDFFYDNLSGGNWLEVEGYGYGWQPDIAVSDPNWRPYADGYWAYTDYGWTWISYEDFGWATYHYGRWARLAGSISTIRTTTGSTGAAGSPSRSVSTPWTAGMPWPTYARAIPPATTTSIGLAASRRSSSHSRRR